VVTAMSLLVFVLVIHLLQTFATILQQLLVAGLLGYLIVPAHQRLIRYGLSPLLSGVVLLAGFLAASYGLGLMLYDSFEDLSANLPHYRRNLRAMIHQAADRVPGLDGAMLEQLIIGPRRTMEDNLATVRSALGSFVGFVSQTVVVLVYLVFLLVEQAGLPRRIEAAFAPEPAQRIMAVVHRVNRSIRDYLMVLTFVSVLAGVLTTAVLWLFGVDYAVLWGILTCLLNYIPYLGCWIAVALPVLLSLVQFESPGLTLAVLAVLVLLQNFIGLVIQPRMAGRRLDLSPFVIILALAFWGTIWGIVGMILAVPVTVIVKIVLENVKETRPLATLMSNR
jgi:predicted PurR-regulated permease PerM